MTDEELLDVYHGAKAGPDETHPMPAGLRAVAEMASDEARVERDARQARIELMCQALGILVEPTPQTDVVRICQTIAYELKVTEARAAYWKAMWLSVATELDIREAREEGEERAAGALEKLSERRDAELAEALAKLKALGAEP